MPDFATLPIETTQAAASSLPPRHKFVAAIRSAVRVEVKVSPWIPTDSVFAMNPEIATAGLLFHSFLLDEMNGLVYVLTHPDNEATARELVATIRRKDPATLMFGAGGGNG